MEGKLIKENNGYTLFVDGKVFGDTDGHQLKSITNRLSTKNCQIIELDCDLDEEISKIVKTIIPDDRGKDIWYGTSIAVGKLCFQKALELLGDKKFSEEDMSKAWSEGYHRKVDEINGNELRYFDKFIQSLQKTEWDVEVEMVKEHIGSGCYKKYPKLDDEGCLILKKNKNG